MTYPAASCKVFCVSFPRRRESRLIFQFKKEILDWIPASAGMTSHFAASSEVLNHYGLINNEIVAMGGFRKISKNIGQIRRMRVHPDYRRKGYAQQIIQKLEEEAKKNKIIELQLKTSIQQEMTHHFYEKNEYNKMEKEKEYYTEGGGNSFEVVWYRKELI